MLEIKDLHASINGKEILKGINLTVNPGEIHALMGQNGAGKSTLSNVLVGNPSYEVTSGSVTFNGKDLLAMKPEERAHEGLFLSFQQPVEIPGVSMVNFMRAAINAKRKYHGMEPMSAGDFLKMMREKRKVVELDSKLANRSVNEGFSGGEKKRNEIFQMAMLEPKLSILDETDSGNTQPSPGTQLKIKPTVMPKAIPHSLAYRGRRFQQIAYAGNFGFGHHPLPTFVGLPQAGCGARAARRTHREKRRSGTGRGDRKQGFRLDQGRNFGRLKT